MQLQLPIESGGGFSEAGDGERRVGGIEHPVQRCPTGFHARGQFGLGDVFLLKNLLVLKGNHALEGQHFHLG
jgi:hypothetical protein